MAAANNRWNFVCIGGENARLATRDCISRTIQEYNRLHVNPITKDILVQQQELPCNIRRLQIGQLELIPHHLNNLVRGNRIDAFIWVIETNIRNQLGAEEAWNRSFNIVQTVYKYLGSNILDHLIFVLSGDANGCESQQNELQEIFRSEMFSVVPYTMAKIGCINADADPATIQSDLVTTMFAMQHDNHNQPYTRTNLEAAKVCIKHCKDYQSALPDGAYWSGAPEMGAPPIGINWKDAAKSALGAITYMAEPIMNVVNAVDRGISSIKLW